MFKSTTSNDPLDGLIKQAEGILGERVQLLEVIARAETRLAESEAKLTAARERIGREEFESAQEEGGLAIASKAAQQVLAEAELKTKSARFRAQGLRAGLAAIEERLAAAWNAVGRYRDDFISDKMQTANEEFERLLKALVRLIYKVHSLGEFPEQWRKTFGKCSPRSILGHFFAGNPYTGITRIDRQLIREGDKITTGDHSWPADPEAAALYDAIDAVNQRVNQLGTALKKGGMTGIECHSESDDDALPKEPAESSPEAIG